MTVLGQPEPLVKTVGMLSKIKYRMLSSKHGFILIVTFDAIMQIPLERRVIGNTNPLPIETLIVCSQIKEE